MSDSTQRVMLLIDADNVSTDIIEQACARLHSEYGALHVRRAYCTAESAVKHQVFFKRLSIKPMVNLAAGKNSTDIALAVDALDLVLAERPDVVVIASSDSDFAPLVSRLREKGCLVRGVGQKGKVGEETPMIYDDFLQFEHRGTRVRTLAVEAAATPAKKTRTPRKNSSSGGAGSSSRSSRSATAPSAEPVAAPAAASAPAKKTRSRKKADEGQAEGAAPPPAAEVPPAPADEAPKPARKTAARKSTRKALTAEAVAAADEAQPAAVSPADTAPTAAEAAAPAKKTRRRKTDAKVAPADAAADVAPTPAVPWPDEVAAVLKALPALRDGKTVELQQVSEKLRRAGLLSRRSTSRKLLGRFPQWFDLQPEHEPTRVSLRTPA